MAYLKMIAAVVVTILTALVPVLTAGHLTTAGVLNVAIVGVGALMIFASANVPGAMYTKAILAALTAALTALVTFVGAGGLGSVTPAEWIQIVIAVAGALGVFLVPNVSSLSQTQAHRATS